MSKFLVFCYLMAIVTANLLVTKFGPTVAIVNALVFIGLDLTIRDLLHENWGGGGLWFKMVALIFSGSILSYIINRNSGSIAVASFVSFLGAGIADTFAYWILGDKIKMIKINGSNIFSSGIDSIIFPIMAFGYPILYAVMVGQFVAKVGGGFLWSITLLAFDKQKRLT